MTTPDVSQAACAHSIVMRSLVSAGSTIYPDAVKDAWHCCDCGTRFLPHAGLPTFPPEKSHLHVKLEHVTLANAALRERAKKAESESAQWQRMLRQAQDLAIGRASRLSRMTAWLELNQPDVFRRGLWDALAAPEGKQS